MLACNTKKIPSLSIDMKHRFSTRDPQTIHVNHLAGIKKIIAFTTNVIHVHRYIWLQNIFQVYKMAPEPFNDRPFYIGTEDDSLFIGFDNCGDWSIGSEKLGQGR